MIDHAQKIAKFYSKRNLQYNLLLNNGPSAGQRILHPHIHLIAREKNDRIKIEIWRRKLITTKEFIRLSQKTKEDFQKTKFN